MNKRQRKKKEMNIKEKYYLKLLINENDKHNPVIKCRNSKILLNKMHKFMNLYDCDVAIACPAYEKMFGLD